MMWSSYFGLGQYTLSEQIDRIQSCLEYLSTLSICDALLGSGWEIKSNFDETDLMA